MKQLDRNFYNKIYKIFKGVPLPQVNTTVSVEDLDRVEEQLKYEGFSVTSKNDYILVTPPKSDRMLVAVVYGRKRWYAFSRMDGHSYIDKKAHIINTGRRPTPLNSHEARFLCFKYVMNWIVNYNKQ